MLQLHQLVNKSVKKKMKELVKYKKKLKTNSKFVIIISLYLTVNLVVIYLVGSCSMYNLLFTFLLLNWRYALLTNWTGTGPVCACWVEFPLHFKLTHKTAHAVCCHLESTARAAEKLNATWTNSMVNDKRLANIFHMVCHASTQMEFVLSLTLGLMIHAKVEYTLPHGQDSLLWVLWFPPTVQRHVGHLNWKPVLHVDYQCECVH